MSGPLLHLPGRGIRQLRISRTSDHAFGGGVVTYPARGGPFGLVAVVPGYTGYRFTVGWYGRRLAARGYVVVTLGTLGRRDLVPARAEQLLAALDHVRTDPRTAELVDPSRLAVIGHSMGGTGALLAAADRSEVRAAVALTPWANSGTRRPQGLRVPTLIVGAEHDRTAPPAQHARPIFEALPPSTPRAYVELRGASHYAPLLRPSPVIEQAVVGWLGHFLAKDPAAPSPSELVAALDDRRVTAAIARP